MRVMCNCGREFKISRKRIRALIAYWIDKRGSRQ